MELKIKHIIAIFFICIQTNCSTKNLKISKDNLIYNNSEQQIILEILNNQQYLSENIVEKIKVKCKNIKKERLSFSGKGISFYKATNEEEKNDLFLNINLKDEIQGLKNYELIVSYHDGNINFTHKFIIPIKKQ